MSSLTSFSNTITSNYAQMSQLIQDMSCVDLSGNFITCPKIDYSQICKSGKVPGFDLSGITPNLSFLNNNSDWANSDINTKDLMNYNYQPLITFFIAFGLVIFYFIVGVFYYEVTHVGLYNLFKEQNADWTAINKSLAIYRFLLFIVIFVLLLVFLYVFVYNFTLRGTSSSMALGIISVCLLTIVGITFLMIHNTTFVKIFENTIGYGLVNAIWGEGINERLKKMFSHQFFKKDIIDKSLPETNFSFNFLFSLLHLHNFKEMIEIIGSGETGVIENPQLQQKDKDAYEKYLFDCVVLKNTVGHLSWVFFSSLVATLVSIRFLSKNL